MLIFEVFYKGSYCGHIISNTQYKIFDVAGLSFIMTFVSPLMFLRRAWCRNVTGSLKQVQKILREDEQVGDETRHSSAPVYGIESGCRTGCSDSLKNAVVCGRYFTVTPVALLHAYYRSVPPFSKHSDCHRAFDLILYDTIWYYTFNFKWKMTDRGGFFAHFQPPTFGFHPF